MKVFFLMLMILAPPAEPEGIAIPFRTSAECEEGARLARDRMDAGPGAVVLAACVERDLPAARGKGSPL